MTLIEEESVSWNYDRFRNDGSEFGGNVWHKVNKDLELGANIGWTQGENTTRFGVAAKYQTNPDTVFRAKLSNTSQVALAMTHSLNRGKSFPPSDWSLLAAMMRPLD